MISFLRYLFPPKTLRIGSIWVHEDSANNPFDEFVLKYKILDVKNNFVKYSVTNDKALVTREDSTPIRSFYAFYRKIKEQ